MNAIDRRGALVIGLGLCVAVLPRYRPARLTRKLRGADPDVVVLSSGWIVTNEDLEMLANVERRFPGIS